MSKPKVFVTRLIPEKGLDRVKESCEADIWTARPTKAEGDGSDIENR